MTGKVVDNSSAVGILVLIVPYAVAAVILYTFWQWILLLLVLTLAWKLWQNYQWLKLSQQVDPLFNRLIEENRGRLTPIDLSTKANLPLATAKRFLEKKKEEYAAQKRGSVDQETVYEFMTVTALGKILDDSEPVDEEEETIVETSIPVTEPPQVEPQPNTVAALENQPLSLIQSELAKRLDTHTSTIGRKKGDPDFADWARSKDPEGVAWQYVAATNLFVSID
jgi:hypothetical protein